MPYGQFFAVGEETTWATPVTRNKFAKVMAGSEINPGADRSRSATLSANVGADPERSFDKAQWGEGKIIIPMSYDDGAGFKMLKHLLGVVSSTTGAGPYVHVLKRATGPPYAGGAVPTATSLSCELNYELPDAGPLQARLLAGARVVSGRFAWNAEEEIVVECDVLGKEQTQVIKTATPTYPDYDTYGATFGQAALSIDGTAYGAVCKGIDFSINNGTERRIRLGSPFTQAPLRRGVAQLSGTIRLDWEASPSAKALWQKFKDNTAAAIVVTLTGPGGYSIVTSLGKVFFTASTLSPEEGQLQSVEFPFEAYDVATDTAVKMTITTPNATI
jgi:hypothetical protein